MIRCGDLDPSLVLFLMQKEQLNEHQATTLLNKHSGLYGLSGLSNDMAELLAEEARGNERAALAIEVFCYRLRKYIASYLGVLGGADALIFTGGIGENAPVIRKRAVERLEPLVDELARTFAELLLDAAFELVALEVGGVGRRELRDRAAGDLHLRVADHAAHRSQLHLAALRHVPLARAERACERGASYLLMGGYGHSRLGEFLFGGVMRTLLLDAPLPLIVGR